jgi:hypothetical protein
MPDSSSGSKLPIHEPAVKQLARALLSTFPTTADRVPINLAERRQAETARQAE